MEKKPTTPNGISGILKSYWKIIVGLILILAGRSSSEPLFVIAGICLVVLFFADLRKKAKTGQEHPEGPETSGNQTVPSVGQIFSEPPSEAEEKPEQWVCERCGATNTGSVCEYCDSPRTEKTE